MLVRFLTALRVLLEKTTRKSVNKHIQKGINICFNSNILNLILDIVCTPFLIYSLIKTIYNRLLKKIGICFNNDSRDCPESLN